MNTFPLRGARIARRPRAPGSIPAAFGEQLSRLYDLAQVSTHVFASPLGPFRAEGGEFHLPRFVYFGPHSSDASVRLAVYGGFGAADWPATLAMLHFIERLVVAPALGEQLSLSFFPRIAVRRDGPALAGENWSRSTHPEVALLAADFRQREYHGFIRVETADGEDTLAIQLRSPSSAVEVAPPVELVNDGDVAPFAVRWEYSAGAATDGPLGLARAAQAQPFELVLRLPRQWTLEEHQQATVAVLSRFVQRYRGFIAYAQHL